MKTTLLCASLLFSNLTYAQPNYQATIEDAKFAALEVINKKEATALSIALVGPDGVIWSQAFGIANPLNGTNASESTLFGIGSVSKLLATMAVMKLVDQGLVELDTPLVNYVPNFSMKSPEMASG